MDDFRSIGRLIAALAPLGLVTSGCGSDLGDFSERTCITSSDGLADLNPAAGVDFVALRSSMGPGAPIETLSQWKTPCTKAMDANACTAALAALPIDPPLAQFGFDAIQLRDVAFTRGSEAGRVTTREELVALLGAIDKPSEAALVALATKRELTCKENNVRRRGDGFVLLGERGTTCGGDIEHYEITVTGSGDVTEGVSEVWEEGDPNCAIGRRPAGLRPRGGRARALGDFFAEAAHLEAASVRAFAQLAGELAAHGAPRSLVRAAWRSRADEIRHARVTASLARRFGGSLVAPAYAPSGIRSLVEVARDNATEGCVRETFGALVATVQAMRALDPAIRRALRRIAVDETRHASLSWAIDSWASARLTSRLRRDLHERRQRAIATLRRDVVRDWPADVTALAGMPGARATRRLVGALERTLWSRA